MAWNGPICCCLYWDINVWFLCGLLRYQRFVQSASSAEFLPRKRFVDSFASTKRFLCGISFQSWLNKELFMCVPSEPFLLLYVLFFSLFFFSKERYVDSSFYPIWKMGHLSLLRLLWWPAGLTILAQRVQLLIMITALTTNGGTRLNKELCSKTARSVFPPARTECQDNKLEGQVKMSKWSKKECKMTQLSPDYTTPNNRNETFNQGVDNTTTWPLVTCVYDGNDNNNNMAECAGISPTNNGMPNKIVHCFRFRHDQWLCGILNSSQRQTPTGLVLRQQHSNPAPLESLILRPCGR
jgi:hypothetical protein